MRSRFSKISAWIIVFLLVIGLAGFGIQDVLRSSGQNEIARFGNQKVTPDDFIRVIQQEVSNLSQRFGVNLTFEQANTLGATQTALQKLISASVIDQTAKDLNISRGNDALIRSIQTNPSFLNLSGSFDPERYKTTIQNLNLEPKQYEEILRKELSRNLMVSIATTKVKSPEVVVGVIANYITEERLVDIITISKEDLKEFDHTVSENEVREFYENSKDHFMQPKTFNISYIHLSPKKLAESITITDQEINNLFNSRKDKINTPEKREVQQIFFNEETTAKLALNSAKSKLSAFTQLILTRDLTESDVSLGEITREELPITARSTVFGSTNVDVFGPFKTDLGFVLYKVNKIIPAIKKTIKDVYQELKDELAVSKAEIEINNIITFVDDEIAGGATLEEIADTTEMVFGNLAIFEGAKLPTFANSNMFRAAVDSADEYATDIQLNDDGSIFSLRVNEQINSFLKDFQSVKRLAEEKALKHKLMLNLENEAKKIINENIEIRKLSDIVRNWEYPIKRNQTFRRFDKPKEIPVELVNKTFDLKENDSGITLKDNKAYIVQILEILPSSAENNEKKTLESQINAQFSQSLEQDIMNTFINSLQNARELKINQTTIDNVINRFQ